MRRIVISISAVAALIAPSEPIRAVKSTEAETDIAQGQMKETAFWALIDHSTANDQDTQLAALRASLDKLTPDQIVDFQRFFDAAMTRANSWNLWGAAYLANGGASDDGFTYFRSWLISKGRHAFDSVVDRPDTLAALSAGQPDEELEFESLAYVAGDAWAATTGREPGEMPRSPVAQIEPSGVPFDENPDALARRYPMLWKRFGDR